jgi:hypothetical protein
MVHIQEYDSEIVFVGLVDGRCDIEPRKTALPCRKTLYVLSFCYAPAGRERVSNEFVGLGVRTGVIAPASISSTPACESKFNRILRWR